MVVETIREPCRENARVKVCKGYEGVVSLKPFVSINVIMHVLNISEVGLSVIVSTIENVAIEMFII